MNEFLDPPERVSVDQRADRGTRIPGVTHRERLSAAGDLVRQLIRHLSVDHDPLRGHTDLTLMKERSEARRRRGTVKIRVAEHDHRCLAPELEQHPLQLTPGLFGDDSSHPGRPGEVDPAGGGMLDQRVDHTAGIGWIVGEQVDHPGGRPASTSARTTAACVRGQSSDALSTTVLA